MPALPNETGIRSTLDRWVETRKLIAEERSQWREEEEHLRRTMELLENELVRLSESIERIEAETTAVELEKNRLAEQNEAALATGDAISRRIAAVEASLTGLISSFPEPLLESTRVLRSQLFRRDGAPPPPSPHRLQTVLGLLGTADRFQADVHVGRELLLLEDGEKAEVRTLYLGLGQAYYLSPGDDRAGYGRPGEEGWQWTSRPKLAADLRRTFAIHDNEAVPEFIRLPVILGNQ